MDNDEKLKNIDGIFSIENKMLLSIENYIDSEIKNIIANKIAKQKATLLKIINRELKIQEKIEDESNTSINNKYFNKKSLNINNI